ncbi:(Fe-S)-binding protein [Synechococcus elongatus]|uniref:Glycolate oxidase iron-sulfur subunit n=1 Tax=Synechococcus elongatus PCC 11801 TaxID=2219813 RepID=A0AAN1QNK8_SYNEL|nr:heterodisulfide reductase-related iron-sulfur binding cluster [Synechococcus elongatus]AZB72649.1 glycolate oxidase [Synechococcus elongatus PCC 11801]
MAETTSAIAAATPHLTDACVHCGFCLSDCPSYRVLGRETDSPRGRVYLMDSLKQGRIELTDTVVEHFDSCLGCLACTSACPSGVQYDQLIDQMRQRIAQEHQRPWPEALWRKLLFTFLPYPQRLRPILRLGQIYQSSGLQAWVNRQPLLQKFPQLAAASALLPPLSESSFRDDWPTVLPAQGDRRFRVGLLLGCVQRLFNPEVNAAAVRVLQANGCEVVIPPQQGCCGAVAHHQGEMQQAQDLARAVITSFEAENLDAILVTASGCGHTLKHYGDILANDPEWSDRAQKLADRVQDVQEFLANVGLTTELQPLQDAPLAIVYQDACHMLHGQKICNQPRQLLQQIPGVELREPVDAQLCCGSAGIYNLVQPEIAAELGQQKARSLAATGAQVIASANIGCYVQIQRHLREQGLNLPILHPLQLLDQAIASSSSSQI